MRTENQRRLDKMLLRRRLGIAAAIALAVLIGAGILVVLSQPVRSERDVEAVVRTAFVEGASKLGRYYTKIESQLDNGKIVVAFGTPSVPPAQGTRLILRERVTWFGLHSYEWNGETK